MRSESKSTLNPKGVFQRLETLINTSHAYLKLKIFQQLAYAMSAFTKLIFIGSLLLFGFMFFCIAGAIAIGEALDALALGYLIVGAVILIIAAVLFRFRKQIDKKIIQKFSAVFFT